MFLVTRTLRAPLSVAATPDELTTIAFTGYHNWLKEKRDWLWAGTDGVTILNTLDAKLRKEGKLIFYKTNKHTSESEVMVEKVLLFSDESSYIERCAAVDIRIDEGEDEPDLSSLGITMVVKKETV